CIVHQGREGLTLDVFDEGVDCSFVGQVERQRRERLRRTFRLQRFEQCVSLGTRCAIRKGYVVSGGRQGADNGRPQSTTAAGDENATFCFRRHAAGSRPMTSDTFWPPNPNELDTAWRTLASRATFGTTSSGIVGSGTA